MSIRVSSYDQTELIEKFSNDEENNYQLIEALLYCGTFCGETSIVSLEAFRLLDIIFNGSTKLWVDPWMLIEQDKRKLKFYKDYADNFNFSPKTLSYQMVHALPIFWDHRYNIESYETLENEKTEFDVSEYYSDLKLDKKIKKKMDEG